MVEVVGATDHRYSTYKYYHYAATVSIIFTHTALTIKLAAVLTTASQFFLLDFDYGADFLKLGFQFLSGSVVQSFLDGLGSGINKLLSLF
jgi:hypothetical protein